MRKPSDTKMSSLFNVMKKKRIKTLKFFVFVFVYLFLPK